MKTRGKTISAWDGDWEARVYARIKTLGYETYNDYLSARPGASYQDLAAELSWSEGLAPVAPVQLERMHAWNVSPSERRDAILDSFVRCLWGALKKGWGIGKYWEIDAIGALTGWYVTWGEGDELDAFEREIFRINPAPGWIPKDSDDPIIQEAAKRVWPTG